MTRYKWMLIDLGVLLCAYYGAWILMMPSRAVSAVQIGWIAGIQLLVFGGVGIYRQLWAYTSMPELTRLLAFNGLVYVLVAVIDVLRTGMADVRFLIVLFLLNCILLSTARLGNKIVRYLHPFYKKRFADSTESSAKSKTMLIGAGAAGREILQKMLSDSKSKAEPVVFIDDDPQKQGLWLNGVPIYGGRSVIAEAVKRFEVDTIILVLPSASVAARQEILNICKDTGCKLFTVPDISDILQGRIQVSKLREVELSDLLGRQESILDARGIAGYLRGKNVVVTGGGGSIGSEICRQLVAFQPEKLVIFDIYENNAYDLEQELRRNYPQLNLFVRIGSVRDKRRVAEVFSEFNPDIVFHAAAHKHVPLMESSPFEAIKNNVLGTYNTACVAREFGVKRFILISTDKAVNPTNVMGASKRLCEMVIQSLNAPGSTEFAAVRFGNVLGSNGSVVPLFKKLIQQRKPLTVTHPDIIRYFMTIPEAARLVLQAGALAKGGEIFILDMGKPVKILTLAENLIRLSGLRPYDDIPIEFCGLRPGEKLYEELSLAEEGMTKTLHDKIFISNPLPFDRETLLQRQIPYLESILWSKDAALLRKTLQEVVVTYKPLQ